MRIRGVRLGLVVVFGALLVACGGGGSTTNTTSNGTAGGGSRATTTQTAGGRGQTRGQEGPNHQGGGGVAGAGAEGAPLKARYIREADAVCSGFDDELKSLRGAFRGLGTQVSRAEDRHAAALLRRLAATLAEETAKLRRLRPPSGDAATISRWLSTAEGATSLLRDVADAYESGNHQRVAKLASEFFARGSKASEIARRYGLKQCRSNAL
jgi:hypothetical protein